MPFPGEPDTLSVTIVVSVYNDAGRIARCIDSLLAQHLKPQSIVVVDDGSIDGTAQVLERYRDQPLVKRVTLSRNAGVPTARNTGVAHSEGEIVVFIDADAFAPPEWLEALAAPFSDPQVGCAGGPDQGPEDDTPFALAANHSLQSWIASGRLRLKNPFVPFAPSGCNLAVRRSAFLAAGGFDERLDRRGEDKELIQRLRRQGQRIVHCDRARIWHHRPKTLRQFLRQNYLSGKARTEILRLAPETFAWPYLVPTGLVLSLAMAFAGLAVCQEPPAVCLLVILGYLLMLVSDSLLAVASTGSLQIAGRVPLTTVAIHCSYGVGLLVGGLRALAGASLGSGRRRSPHSDILIE